MNLPRDSSPLILSKVSHFSGGMETDAVITFLPSAGFLFLAPGGRPGPLLLGSGFFFMGLGHVSGGLCSDSYGYQDPDPCEGNDQFHEAVSID